MVPSSSGLGHRPLTAVTRVRVPLESPIIMQHLTVLFFFMVFQTGRTPGSFNSD